MQLRPFVLLGVAALAPGGTEITLVLLSGGDGVLPAVTAAAEADGFVSSGPPPEGVWAGASAGGETTITLYRPPDPVAAGTPIDGADTAWLLERQQVDG